MVTALSQSDYVKGFVMSYEERHQCRLRRYTSPRQQEDPPLLEDLPKQQPPADERKVLGEAGYAAVGTRLDISLTVARLAQFTERWGPRAALEILHLLGYLGL